MDIEEQPLNNKRLDIQIIVLIPISAISTHTKGYIRAVLPTQKNDTLYVIE
jgi:hypothetical protein